MLATPYPERCAMPRPNCMPELPARPPACPPGSLPACLRLQIDIGADYDGIIPVVGRHEWQPVEGVVPYSRDGNAQPWEPLENVLDVGTALEVRPGLCFTSARSFFLSPLSSFLAFQNRKTALCGRSSLPTGERAPPTPASGRVWALCFELGRAVKCSARAGHAWRRLRPTLSGAPPAPAVWREGLAVMCCASQGLAGGSRAQPRPATPLLPMWARERWRVLPTALPQPTPQAFGQGVPLLPRLFTHLLAWAPALSSGPTACPARPPACAPAGSQVRVHKVRDPSLYRFPLQLVPTEEALAARLEDPDNYEPPLDLREPKM